MTTSPKLMLLAEIPHLRRYALVLTRNHDAADDLVQNCLERALRNFHKWRRDKRLRPWLFAIMHNLHIDHLRRPDIRAETVSFDAMTTAPSVEATQQSALEAKEVLQALQALPQDQRSVLLLVGVEQLTYQEAAEVLDAPLGTVMSRLHRAREKLRVELGMAPARAPLRRIK